jgi:hypothetical protein
MAFHPFRIFRKHQKVVFAALTIICMLTFVFTSGISGAGGFLDEVSRWFGLRSRIPDMGTLYGRSVSVRDVQLLQQQRRLANPFMASAVAEAANNVMMAVDKIPEFDIILKNSLRNLQQQAAFARFGFGSPADYAREFDLFVRRLSDLENRLTTAKKPDDVQQVELLRALVERDFWRTQNQDQASLLEQLRGGQQQQPLYFGGSLSLEGCLDFMIWQRQADRLGINLSTDDVRKAIGDETLNVLSKEQAISIQRQVGLLSRGVPQNLLNALGEEFRVRLAKDALLGQDPNSISQVPAPVTPYELWDYYLRYRTQASVKLLPIPVSRFLAQVKDQPTDKELQELYEKYKDAVYDPQRETPAFMQPRRLKIAWAQPSADSDYYRKQTKMLLLSQVALMAGNPLQAAVLTVPVLKAYDQATFRDLAANFLKIPSLNQTDFALAIYTYQAMNRPQTASSIVGLLAAPGTGALAVTTAIPAVAMARESAELAPAVAQEARARLPFSVALLAAGGSPLPSVTFAATWLGSGQIEQYLPLAAVKNRLIKEFDDDLAKNLVKLDQTNFKEELQKLKKDLGKQADKYEAAAREFIKKSIENHKWKHGESTGLHDRYDIIQDPGLKPVKEAYLAHHKRDAMAVAAQAADEKGKKFGALFFADTTTDNRLFAPEELFPNDENIIHWRIEDHAAETLPFDKVRAKVVEAWRFGKARTLAHDEAERLAKEARKSTDPLPILREAAKNESLIDIDGIARLARSLSASAQFSGTYQPYTVAESKIEYPPADFVEKVLELNKVNDVTVLTNGPKNIYYVTVLINRSEPAMTEYREAALRPRLEQERRLAYQLGFMAELRTEARLQINDEARKYLEEKNSPLQE